jgi:hypothetical protein
MVLMHIGCNHFGSFSTPDGSSMDAWSSRAREDSGGKYSLSRLEGSAEGCRSVTIENSGFLMLHELGKCSFETISLFVEAGLP